MQGVFHGFTGIVAQPVRGGGKLMLQPASSPSWVDLVGCTLVLCFYVTWCIVGGVCVGAMKGGFLGFLKGTGKGVIGLVLRPTGGLIDFTSTTLSVVQK